MVRSNRVAMIEPSFQRRCGARVLYFIPNMYTIGYSWLVVKVCVYIYIYHYIPLYIIIYHYIPLYTIIYHYIPLHTIIYHYISLYTTIYTAIYHYNQLYTIITIVYHYIPLHTIVYQYIPLHTNVYHYIPLYIFVISRNPHYLPRFYTRIFPARPIRWLAGKAIRRTAPGQNRTPQSNVCWRCPLMPGRGIFLDELQKMDNFFCLIYW